MVKSAKEGHQKQWSKSFEAFKVKCTSSPKGPRKTSFAFFNEERLLIGEQAICPGDMSPLLEADTHRNYFKHTHINMHALSLRLPTYCFPHKRWWLLHQESTPLHSPWLSFSLLHFWFLQVIKSKNYLGYVSSILFFPIWWCSLGFAVGAVESDYSERWLQQSKMVLGSRPPRCVNKCLSCRPCMAALVIPSHQWNKFKATNHGDGDDNYYLLSWKCKCGDKLFQPWSYDPPFFQLITYWPLMYVYI